MNELPGFGRLKWVMERSSTKTLASKLRSRVCEVYARPGHAQTATAPRKGLEVEEGTRREACGSWRGRGGISLAREKGAKSSTTPVPPVWTGRSECSPRLLADACELCGSREQVEVHHVRHLKDLREAPRVGARHPGGSR